MRISPTTGTLSFTYTGKGGLPIPRLTFLYILYIILAAAVIFLLVRLFLFMRDKLHEAPIAGYASAAGAGARAAGAKGAAGRAGARAPAQSRARKLVPLMEAESRRRVRPTVTSLRKTLPRAPMQQSASLPPQIEMRVSQQNSHIGFRNVHRISQGSSRRIGGRFSPYLVFLVPVPFGIAEITNDNGTYVFTPLRPELFPRLSGPVVGCLGQEIPFTTPKGRDLTVSFRTWVSPLEEINRLMRSVSREG